MRCLTANSSYDEVADAPNPPLLKAHWRFRLQLRFMSSVVTSVAEMGLGSRVVWLERSGGWSRHCQGGSDLFQDEVFQRSDQNQMHEVRFAGNNRAKGIYPRIPQKLDTSDSGRDCKNESCWSENFRLPTTKHAN